jgi:hypothetical protein
MPPVTTREAPTIGDLLDLPPQVYRGDLVVNLADDVNRPDKVLDNYVVTPQLVDEKKKETFLIVCVILAEPGRLVGAVAGGLPFGGRPGGRSAAIASVEDVVPVAANGGARSVEYPDLARAGRTSQGLPGMSPLLPFAPRRSMGRDRQPRRDDTSRSARSHRPRHGPCQHGASWCRNRTSPPAGSSEEWLFPRTLQRQPLNG